MRVTIRVYGTNAIRLLNAIESRRITRTDIFISWISDLIPQPNLRSGVFLSILVW